MGQHIHSTPDFLPTCSNMGSFSSRPRITDDSSIRITCCLSGPTSKVTLMKAVDELVWADSQMLGCRGIFTVGLLQPLEFDVAVRGPKTG